MQFFRSTDFNAPVMSGQAGALTNMLDACLGVGYVTATVSALVSSGGMATATIAANTTLRTGDFVSISGANETAYNGTFPITVASSTSIQYPVVGGPTSPATGSITYRKAGLGWLTPFSSTNIRVYRSPDNTSNQFYVRVDDTGSVANVKEGAIRGFETMSDVNTGTGPFPTAAQMVNGVFWNKSITADAVPRTWCLFGDSRTFYLIIHNGNFPILFGFGHFHSVKPGDGYNTFLGGTSISNFTTGAVTPLGFSGVGAGITNGTASPTHTSLYLPRAYNQIGGAVSCNSYDGGITVTTTANGVRGAFGSALTGIPYPNGPDSGLWLTPLFILDFLGVAPNIRGRYPGLFTHIHAAPVAANLPNNNYDLVTGVVGLTGVTLVAANHGFPSGNSLGAGPAGMVYFDLTGPWT